MLHMVVTPVVVGIVWRMIYASDIGVLNFVAKALTGSGYNILAEPALALPAVILMDIWEWTPFMFLVLLAGLQSLPQEPFEAARVDGATAWQSFRDGGGSGDSGLCVGGGSELAAHEGGQLLNR